jgi:hypothetical protein
MDMNVTPNDPPRKFTVGLPGQTFSLKDCGRIALNPDEQITFVTPSGTQLDITRKRWGYYATPSLNARLPAHGLRAVLGGSSDGKYFLLLVEKGCEADFERYMARERQRVIAWLDTTESLQDVERKLAP